MLFCADWFLVLLPSVSICSESIDDLERMVLHYPYCGGYFCSTDHFRIPSITDSGKAMSKCGFEITITSSEDLLVSCRPRQFVGETSV